MARVDVLIVLLSIGLCATGHIKVQSITGLKPTDQTCHACVISLVSDIIAGFRGRAPHHLVLPENIYNIAWNPYFPIPTLDKALTTFGSKVTKYDSFLCVSLVEQVALNEKDIMTLLSRYG